MSSASTSSGSRFPSPTKSQDQDWPTYNPYPTHWPYPSTYPSQKPEPYPDPDLPIMYIPDRYSEPLQTLFIVAIVFTILGIVACAVSCYRGSRARKAREAAATLPGSNGPPMHALPLAVTQVQAGIILPAGMQSFPIYVTNQRGQNGEELVLVPRHILQQPLQPPGPGQSRVLHPLQPIQSSSKDQRRSVEDEKHLRSLEAIRQSSGAYLTQEGSGVGDGSSSSAGAVPSSSTVNRGELLLQKPYSQQEREHEQGQEGQQKQTQTQQVQEQPQGQEQSQQLLQQQQRQPQSASSSSSSSSSAALQNGLQTHVVLHDVPDKEEEAALQGGEDELAPEKVVVVSGSIPSSEK